MSTLDRIKKLFIEKLDIKEDALLPETKLEILGLDSLDKIEFMFALEDEFNIKIPERGVTINTVQDVVDVVDKFVAEQHSNSNA